MLTQNLYFLVQILVVRVVVVFGGRGAFWGGGGLFSLALASVGSHETDEGLVCVSKTIHPIAEVSKFWCEVAALTKFCAMAPNACLVVSFELASCHPSGVSGLDVAPV